MTGLLHEAVSSLEKASESSARLLLLLGLWRGGAFQSSAMRPSARRAICGQQVTD